MDLRFLEPFAIAANTGNLRIAMDNPFGLGALSHIAKEIGGRTWAMVLVIMWMWDLNEVKLIFPSCPISHHNHKWN